MSSAKQGYNKGYTHQYRQQAMDQVRVQGKPPMVAARELGIPFSTLLAWLKKAGWVRQPAGSAALPDDVSALKVKVADLQRQVERLKADKEILKKATAYFASQNL
jgi:transposase-like protein